MKWFLFENVLPCPGVTILFFDHEKNVYAIKWDKNCAYVFTHDDEFYIKGIYLKSYNMIAWMPLFQLESLVPTISTKVSAWYDDEYVLPDENDFLKDASNTATIQEYKKILEIYKEAEKDNTLEDFKDACDYYPQHGINKKHMQNNRLKYIIQDAAQFRLRELLNPTYGVDLDKQYLQQQKYLNKIIPQEITPLEKTLLNVPVPKLISKLSEKIKLTTMPDTSKRVFKMQRYNPSEHEKMYTNLKTAYEELAQENKEMKEKMEEFYNIICDYKKIMKDI